MWVWSFIINSLFVLAVGAFIGGVIDRDWSDDNGNSLDFKGHAERVAKKQAERRSK